MAGGFRATVGEGLAVGEAGVDPVTQEGLGILAARPPLESCS